MPLMRRPILLAARSPRVKSWVETMPVSAGIVTSYVAGERVEDAVRAATELSAAGLSVSLDHLGEDTGDEAQATAIVAAYEDLLQALHRAELAVGADVSVKLTAVGLALPGGERIALENTRRICRAARNVGATVTVDMEDHNLTDVTLHLVRELRQDFPETGAVLQAYLRRTEADCHRLAYEGSRVRLCKGAYDEPEDVAFASRLEVDLSYVRCLKVLIDGPGHPMIATHDPRMIRLARHLIAESGRAAASYEYQMLYGTRPAEQRRLADLGEQVRVYVPYGEQWYGYLMRRLAERPQNLRFFLRSLMSKK